MTDSTQQHPDMWCISFAAPEEHLGGYEMAMEPLDGAIVTSGKTEAGIPVQVYVQRDVPVAEVEALLGNVAEVYGDPIPVVTVEKLPDVDWVAESQKALPPIHAGRFYVYGSHVQDAPPADSIPLLIEANVAFGTGQHDTTKGCLLALTDLAEKEAVPVASALDMGTGSGILAMALRHLWQESKVLAVDIDEPSIRVTIENAELNRVSGIEALAGDGYATAAVGEQAPFDLIVANILAEPLCMMAADLDKALKPGGHAVLSGLLITQQEQVQKAHEALGLTLKRELHLGDWATLVFEKP